MSPCSRNARPQKALVGRAQLEGPPAPLLEGIKKTSKLGRIVMMNGNGRVACWSPGRHGRLTVSPACATVTLVIPRVAHLAQRAASEGPRWTRVVG